MKEKQQYGLIGENFEMYFEPEQGINDPREFTDEILTWAKKENKDITIIEESMEPVIEVDGQKYVCKLGDVGATAVHNPIAKLLKLQVTNSVVGTYLGYKWVYLYKILD